MELSDPGAGDNISDYSIIETRIIFLIDNRIFPSIDVITEAYLSSFYRGITQIIQEFCDYILNQSWYKFPVVIIFAASPQTTQLIQISSENFPLLFNLLEPKYYSTGGNNLVNLSWQNYFSDGIQRITQYLIMTPNHQSNFSIEKTVVLVYSPEVSTFGSTNCGSILDGLKSFQTKLDQLFPLKDLIEVRFACCGVFKNAQLANKHRSQITQYEANELLFSSNILQKYSNVYMDKILCSPTQFDTERKYVLGIISPRKIINLELPTFQTIGTIITFQLYAQASPAIRSVLQVKKFEICGLTTRTGINPAYIAGDSLTMHHLDANVGRKLFGCQEK
jgi:hypothetical protein